MDEEVFRIYNQSVVAVLESTCINNHQLWWITFQGGLYKQVLFHTVSMCTSFKMTDHSYVPAQRDNSYGISLEFIQEVLDENQKLEAER